MNLREGMERGRGRVGKGERREGGRERGGREGGKEGERKGELKLAVILA